MYAENVTGSMKKAIEETNRRRGKNRLRSINNTVLHQRALKRKFPISWKAHTKCLIEMDRGVKLSKVAEEIIQYSRTSPEHGMKKVKTA